MCLFRFNDFQKMAPKVFSSFNSTPQTGNGGSNHLAIVHGYSCIKGKGKHPMEDVLVTEYREFKGRKLAYFAVFDGHLGDAVAVFLKNHLIDNILNQREFFEDPKAALRNAYWSTDAVILEKPELGPGGSTAVTAIVIDKKLFVANVGDSRAVLCEDGEAKQLSVDHEPNSERQLVESRGGHVTNFPGDVARVDGQLAVARAFGDKSLKQHLSADPDIFEVSLTSTTEFLILGSDGLWKVMKNQQAVDLIKDIDDPKDAARCLTDAALGKKSRDDISCVVVRFDQTCRS